MNPDQLQPEGEAQAVDQARLLREYVSGGQQAALAAIRQALPQYIDDVTKDYGGDVYERMLTDPAVNSAFQSLKLAILADGVRVEPAVPMPADHETPDPEELSRAEQAKELADFVQRCLDGADQSVLDIAGELLDGLAYGNKVAEIVLKPGSGDDAGRLVLQTVKGKHRKNVAFVVDPYLNLIGLLGVQPGKTISQGLVALGEKPELQDSFVPRYKFVVFQNGIQDGDPRGTSILRPAYNSWFLKTQVLPEYYKFLRQFASPGIIGKTPENDASGGFVPKTNPDGTPITDANGIPTLITAEQALMNALLGWMNASVLVVRGGTQIDFLQSEGSGEAFLSATDYFDRQIHTAITGTDGLTMAAKNDSQGAKETGQDVAGLRVGLQKIRLGDAITRDVIRLLVLVNFGEDALKLAPKAVLAKVEQQDWAKELQALADAYGKGFIHDSQLQALDARLGLPPRDMEQIAMEKAEQAAMGRMAAGEIGKVYNPAEVDRLADDQDEGPKKKAA